MKKPQSFLLYPFPNSDDPPELTIYGALFRQGDILNISSKLSGFIDQVKIPTPGNKPARKNRLWEVTCFEFFIKANGSKPYWEFNFSPSGNWNVYRFDDYREGMTEETAFSSLPFQVSRQTEALNLDVKLNLKKIIPPDLTIRAGVSVVIKTIDVQTFYWALAHPAPKPDFHHPESFILEL